MKLGFCQYYFAASRKICRNSFGLSSIPSPFDLVGPAGTADLWLTSNGLFEISGRHVHSFSPCGNEKVSMVVSCTGALYRRLREKYREGDLFPDIHVRDLQTVYLLGLKKVVMAIQFGCAFGQKERATPVRVAR